VIKLQEELLIDSLSQEDANAADDEQKEFVEGSKRGRIQWKVGDRCLAPSANGQKYVAFIDGISQEKVAITFVGNGIKYMVRMHQLRPAPAEEKKSYIFENSKSGSTHKKNEWQVERERRKSRAQKKEQRKKNLDEAKEGEKSKWQNFNVKGQAKNMKGFKKAVASASAPDGPAGGMKRMPNQRQDPNTFRATQRGNMDSLF